MFPFDLDEDTEVLEKEEVPYREYEIDYRTGQLTGRIVEGLEALKVWIYLTLNTDRYCYQQYSWDYGSEINSLAGSSSDPEYISMNAKRMLSECLLQNPHISSIGDFDAEIEDGKIRIFFVAETDYGKVGMNV